MTFNIKVTFKYVTLSFLIIQYLKNFHEILYV